MPLVEWESPSRESLFDREYFGGGRKVGGYAREGYRDFPCHDVTARIILARKPQSVLEVGCARGYVLKRIQDASVAGVGMEISRHCLLTRACDGITEWDICKTPWPFPDNAVELLYSVATMEHVPEQFLPAVIGEMARLSRRGLHGIDFGENDDGFDRTHCSLFPKRKWLDLFAKHAPDYPVAIVDKEELEAGALPAEVLRGDGKSKWNIGSFTTMHHHGWVNCDIHDLGQFAQAHGYVFHRQDVRQGLPVDTGSVDLIASQHFLEHLTYEEGMNFLRECRRALKPGGVMRIAVPDADLLSTDLYETPDALELFDEINDGCANAATPLERYWSLLHAGHAAAYDEETLTSAMRRAGFECKRVDFRQTAFDGGGQILAETIDMLPCLSLYVEARVP